MSSPTPARQPEGVPTGGQFATTGRTEPGLALTDEEPAVSAVEYLRAQELARSQAEPVVAAAAMSLVARAVLGFAPNATHLLLEWTDQGSGHEGWYPSEVFEGSRRIATHVHELDAGGDPDELYDDVKDSLCHVNGPQHAAMSPAFGSDDNRDAWHGYTSDSGLLDLRAAAAAYPPPAPTREPVLPAAAYPLRSAGRAAPPSYRHS